MDVNTNGTIDASDTVGAFAALFGNEDASDKKPSETSEATTKTTQPKAPEAPQTDDTSDQQVQEDEVSGEEQEGGEEQQPERKFVDEDEVFVKVKVDGEEREVSVKDLKRLAGQEAALTRKAQEASAHRKQIDEAATVQAVALERLLNRAVEKWQPFAKVDLLQAAQTLDPSELAALRAEMQMRYEDVRFLESELTGITQQVQARQSSDYTKAAQECIKTLSDPVDGIEGWGKPLYGELVAYASSAGLPREIVSGLTDPAAFKIIHKAMMFDRGKQSVTAEKGKTAKGKLPPPKKIVKSSTDVGRTREATGSTKKAADAMKRLSSTGSVDSAAAAFEARWALSDSD